MNGLKMLPSDGPMQVIRRLQRPSKGTLGMIITTRWLNGGDYRIFNQLARVKRKWKEGKNNLVNDSINRDFLQSIEKEEIQKIIKTLHKEDGFISFIKSWKLSADEKRINVLAQNISIPKLWRISKQAIVVECSRLEQFWSDLMCFSIV